MQRGSDRLSVHGRPDLSRLRGSCFISSSRRGGPRGRRYGSDLADTLRDQHASDPLVEAVERRPHKARYATVHELAESVVRARHTR